MIDKLHVFVEWTKLKIRIHHREHEAPLYFKEREVWWASLGVNIGFEQDGKHQTFERPVLVLKKFNNHVLWILPMTSKPKFGKYYFSVVYNGKMSNMILSQLRLVSSKRLLRKIRTLPISEFTSIRRNIKDLL